MNNESLRSLLLNREIPIYSENHAENVVYKRLYKASIEVADKLLTAGVGAIAPIYTVCATLFLAEYKGKLEVCEYPDCPINGQVGAENCFPLSILQQNDLNDLHDFWSAIESWLEEPEIEIVNPDFLPATATN
ncbi:hypothetical protein VRRI112168_02430 [Vreelandella rituensis]|uniref:Uncharacterized protein n=1 Tax=Vreelandella rituensis TaxID=2282306 RepID=A0A368U931_9GAMM|nr:hypothetical protein [Halomonas rituensis]RCV93600.1 hypothetical protein DU506_00150 [Halomonas rituensis]